MQSTQTTNEDPVKQLGDRLERVREKLQERPEDESFGVAERYNSDLLSIVEEACYEGWAETNANMLSEETTEQTTATQLEEIYKEVCEPDRDPDDARILQQFLNLAASPPGEKLDSTKTALHDLDNLVGQYEEFIQKHGNIRIESPLSATLGVEAVEKVVEDLKKWLQARCNESRDNRQVEKCFTISREQIKSFRNAVEDSFIKGERLLNEVTRCIADQNFGPNNYVLIYRVKYKEVSGDIVQDDFRINERDTRPWALSYSDRRAAASLIPEGATPLNTSIVAMRKDSDPKSDCVEISCRRKQRARIAQKFMSGLIQDLIGSGYIDEDLALKRGARGGPCRGIIDDVFGIKVKFDENNAKLSEAFDWIKGGVKLEGISANLNLTYPLEDIKAKCVFWLEKSIKGFSHRKATLLVPIVEDVPVDASNRSFKKRRTQTDIDSLPHQLIEVQVRTTAEDYSAEQDPNSEIRHDKYVAKFTESLDHTCAQLSHLNFVYKILDFLFGYEEVDSQKVGKDIGFRLNVVND